MKCDIYKTQSELGSNVEFKDLEAHSSINFTEAATLVKSVPQASITCRSIYKEGIDLWCAVQNTFSKYDTSTNINHFKGSFATPEAAELATRKRYFLRKLDPPIGVSNNAVIDHFDTNSAPVDCQASKCYVLKGNTIYIKEIYDYPGHPGYYGLPYGHLAQVAYRLVELRRMFPEYKKIDNFLFLHGAKHKFPQVLANLVRLAMHNEGYQLPKFLFADHEMFQQENIFFENLLVADQSREYMYTKAGAAQLKANAFEMCGLEQKRRQQQAEQQANQAADTRKKVLFVARADMRKMFNIDELCTFTGSVLNYNVRAVNPGGLSFCEQVELFDSADIIVSGQGSANVNLVFVKPGTVVLEAATTRYRIPFAKSLAYYAGAHILEYMNMDISLNKHVSPSLGSAWDKPMSECENDYYCLRPYAFQERTVFPLAVFKDWIQYAVDNLYNKPFNATHYNAPCEEPSNWPSTNKDIKFAIEKLNQGEYNYHVCEPAKYCVCCHYKDCKQYVEG